MASTPSTLKKEKKDESFLDKIGGTLARKKKAKEGQNKKHYKHGSAQCSDWGTYKMRSAKMRKCENGQRIKCEIESAKCRCENMYKMRKTI